MDKSKIIQAITCTLCILSSVIRAQDNSANVTCTILGYECKFPFVYHGDEYTNCIPGIRGMWCGIKQEVSKSSLGVDYDYCIDQCPTDKCTGRGYKCIFPFEFDGKNYTSCISYQTFTRTYSWCPIVADYQGRGEGIDWGYCSHICPEGGPKIMTMPTTTTTIPSTIPAPSTTKLMSQPYVPRVSSTIEPKVIVLTSTLPKSALATPMEVDTPSVIPVEVDTPSATPVEVGIPSATPVEINSVSTTPVEFTPQVEFDIPSTMPMEVDTPSAKPVKVVSLSGTPVVIATSVEVDTPSSTPVEFDTPSAIPMEVDTPFTTPPTPSRIKTSDSGNTSRPQSVITTTPFPTTTTAKLATLNTVSLSAINAIATSIPTGSIQITPVTATNATEMTETNSQEVDSTSTVRTSVILIDILVTSVLVAAVVALMCIVKTRRLRKTRKDSVEKGEEVEIPLTDTKVENKREDSCEERKKS